jgi:6-phosphogluconolactonase
MTLSLGRILASKLIIIYFTGEKKRQTYQQALTAGPVENLPIRSMLTQQQCPVAVYWAP